MLCLKGTPHALLNKNTVYPIQCLVLNGGTWGECTGDSEPGFEVQSHSHNITSITSTQSALMVFHALHLTCVISDQARIRRTHTEEKAR